MVGRTSKWTNKRGFYLLENPEMNPTKWLLDERIQKYHRVSTKNTQTSLLLHLLHTHTSRKERNSRTHFKVERRLSSRVSFRILGLRWLKYFIIVHLGPLSVRKWPHRVYDHHDKSNLTTIHNGKLTSIMEWESLGLYARTYVLGPVDAPDLNNK